MNVLQKDENEIRNIKKVITKVFEIYNYKLDVCKDIKCSIKRVDGIHPKKSLIKFLDKSNRLKCEIMFRDFRSQTFFKYRVTISLKRDKNSFKDIEFILNNVIRVYRRYCRDKQINLISETSFNHLIDDSIQNSIILILLKSKDNASRSLKTALVSNIEELIEKLSSWANRTYEGRKIPFSFLIDLDMINFPDEIFDKINKFLLDDSSALITDGISSYFELGDKLSYKIIKYYDPEEESLNEYPFVPYRFSSFGNMCDVNKIGIILNIQGDILLIKNKKLVFAKRNGNWIWYDYDAFHDTLFKDMKFYRTEDDEQKHEIRERIKKIYITCLDVAFARTGGCLAMCLNDKIDKIIKDINVDDLHDEFVKNNVKNPNTKREILENIIVNKKLFYLLNRKSRLELLGIDGATIISDDWKIVTTGAILDNKIPKKIKDLHGGARTKIAIKLSQYGIAIKISADGYIECYKKMKHIF